MDSAAAIKDAIERSVKAVSLRPSVGQGTAKSIAVLGPGLSCEVTEGPYRVVLGMTEKYGGNDAGPNPGVIGRAALGSCLAIGIGMWAARMEIPLDSLEVEVQADYDARGELGVSADVPAGYSAMRYSIRATSSAPEAMVRAMLETAVKYSSYVDNFARAVPLTGDVRVVKS